MDLANPTYLQVPESHAIGVAVHAPECVRAKLEQAPAWGGTEPSLGQQLRGRDGPGGVQSQQV